MLTLFIVILIIVSVALALFVLIQNPKGGGLSTGGSGSNMFGVQRTGDVLEKGTWILLALIVVLSLTITTIAKTGNGSTGSESRIEQQLDKTPPASPIGSGLSTPPPPTAPATKDSTGAR